MMPAIANTSHILPIALPSHTKFSSARPPAPSRPASWTLIPAGPLRLKELYVAIGVPVFVFFGLAQFAQ
jgi:hypothetical protein